MGSKILVTEDTYQKAFELAKTGLPQREQAALLGFSRSTYQRLYGSTSEEPDARFREAVEAGRASLFRELASVLIDDALTNRNPETCKWLMTKVLGQHERFSENARQPQEPQSASPALTIVLQTDTSEPTVTINAEET